MELTKEQIDILDTINNDDLRVVNVKAGPGSGKSTLISLIIASYLCKPGYDLSDFLCLSFTNESWIELREKIMTICDRVPRDDFNSLCVTTFHKYCASLINEDTSRENLLHYSPEKLSSKQRKEEKKRLSDELICHATVMLDKYSEINSSKSISENCNDADLSINENLLNKKILFLDEAQDLNADIYELICSLMRATRIANNKDLKIFTFSDVCQSIFVFDEADPKCVDDISCYDPKGNRKLKKRLKDTCDLPLTTNFRSSNALDSFFKEYRQNILSDKTVEIKEKEDKTKAVKYILVNKKNCCDAIVKKVSEYVGELKEKSSIGVIVPTGPEANSIYERLKYQYNDSKNITVKSTDGFITPFSLFSLDEMHSWCRILYEAFAEYSKKPFEKYFGSNNMYIGELCIAEDVFPFYNGPQSKEFDIASNDFNLKKCKEKFRIAYETSPYKEAVMDFFEEFMKEYEYEFNNEEKYKTKVYTDKNYSKSVLIDVFTINEFLTFRDYIKKYSFDDFYRGFVKKTDGNELNNSNDELSSIEISISTIHKSKGHEYDAVFMACLHDDEKWINKEDSYAFVKCRYVAMTRAKSELFVFNDKSENNYFDSNRCEDLTDVNYDHKYDHKYHDGWIFMSPRDLVLSYCQYRDMFYTQFIPTYDSEISEGKWTMFPDTPKYLQAGKELKLENIISNSGANRFVFTSKERNISCERLANGTEGSINEGWKDQIKQLYDNVKECAPEDSGKIPISKVFTKTCEEEMKIEIGAVIIYDEVYAPWKTEEVDGYAPNKLQDYWYYEVADDECFLKNDLNKLIESGECYEIEKCQDDTYTYIKTNVGTVIKNISGVEDAKKYTKKIILPKIKFTKHQE